MEELKKVVALKQELDSLRPIDAETEAKIMQKFRLDWNYHSNHLEGNTLTYGETKALLLFNITAQGKPLKDHLEVTGHNEAINWVIDIVKGDYPLTENFIRQIHQLLLKEPYEVDAITPDGKPTKKKVHVGEYKKTPNHVKTVTGEIFRFATPEETPAKMTDLLNWYRNKIEEENINPILLAAEFHYKFIRIHPFDDGNGRTARIIMNFILMKYGFPPTIIKTQDKENYFAALRLADAGNIEAFINYIAQNLVHSLELMISGAKGENIEEEDDVEKELKILEKRLMSVNEVKQIPKSRDEVEIILKNSAFRLSKKLEENHTRLFSRFYEKFYFSFFLNDERQKGYLFDSLDNFNQILHDFKIFIEFKGFKSQGYNTEYLDDLSFRFYGFDYEIQSGNYRDENQITYFRKKYREQLSNDEIDYLVSKTVKDHKNFIEDIIAKKEKENSKKL